MLRQRYGTNPTFFAVMLIVVKCETVVTGALVAADHVLTYVLATAVVGRTLVLIYIQGNRTTRDKAWLHCISTSTVVAKF